MMKKGWMAVVRICLFGAVIFVAGCGHAYWLRVTDSADPRFLHEKDSEEGWTVADWPEDAAEFADAEGFDELDWPLMVVVRELSDRTKAIDCRRGRDPFRCLLEASQDDKPAFLYRSRWGDDSVHGWAAVVSGEGKLVLLRYDSSPCGRVTMGACGFELIQRPCDELAVPQINEIQLMLCERPAYGFQQTALRR